MIFRYVGEIVRCACKFRKRDEKYNEGVHAKKLRFPGNREPRQARRLRGNRLRRFVGRKTSPNQNQAYIYMNGGNVNESHRVVKNCMHSAQKISFENLHYIYTSFSARERQILQCRFFYGVLPRPEVVRSSGARTKFLPSAGIRTQTLNRRHPLDYITTMQTSPQWIIRMVLEEE